MNFKQGLRKKDDDRDENEDEKSVYTLTILEVVCVYLEGYARTQRSLKLKRHPRMRNRRCLESLEEV